MADPQLYFQDFPVNTPGTRTITVPSYIRWVTIQNPSSYAIAIHKGADTAGSRFAYASPFAFVTQYVPSDTNQVTISWSGGGGADQFSVIFSDVSLGINQTLLTPGGTSSVVIAGDSVGLARKTQLPDQLEDGRLPIVSRKFPQACTFIDAAVAITPGTPLVVGGLDTVTLEVYGSSASRTLVFEGAGPSGVYRPLMAVNLSSAAADTGTTGTGELWQLDIRGLAAVRVRLTAVAGGDVTVKGVAV